MPRTTIIPLSDPKHDTEGIAEQAISGARMLVDTTYARVVLVSAIDDESARTDRQAYLDRIAGTIGHNVESIVEVGDPENVILGVVTRTDDPIIVMASHGRGGVRLRVLGSVATAVADQARGPVMILPISRANQSPVTTQIERVLLPIYDRSIADALVDATIAVLGAERAKVLDFYLAEVAVPIPPLPSAVTGDRYHDARDVPTHFLSRVADRMNARGYRATSGLHIGEPSQVLTRVAVKDRIDLMVMPARGRHGLNSLVPEIFAEQARMPRAVPILLVHLEAPSN